MQMVGEGVHLYNVRHNGGANAISYDNIGTFHSNRFPGLSMDSGMVLTTGDVNVAVGPNNSTNKEIQAGEYMDTVLGLFSGENVRTCSALDFDFVSLGTQMSVRYLFGSEEYPEYVCSSYNDIFAFLVTGTDPATGRVCTRNIAVIPSTQDENNPNGIPVSINSVNSGSGGNPNTSGCYYDYSEYYIENVYESGIQYDGYTEMLSAEASILPGEVYHMHISVCNVGDGGYGSGVFLDGKSFRALEINPEYCRAWSRGWVVDTIAPNNHPRIVFNPLYINLIEAQIDFSFVGAINMVHFNCERDDGTVVTNVDPHLYLPENSSTVVTFSPIVNRLPATPMPFQIRLLTHGKRINVGGDTTQVMLYDTLDFVLTTENISSGN
ncbi:MAG: choice-of-anchor L domain-containing protein [Bacteroidales bacterium]|nr:choice-of-anchor L domain-containing protein [Bacteroidales bacterium]